MKILRPIIGCGLLGILCSSCGTKLITKQVAYQSVRTEYAQPTQMDPIPNEAKIAVSYMISEKGDLTAVVYNRTSEIMIIDQTMSFFVNSDGRSVSYYDPTVRTTSTTDLSSTTTGGSVNLGAITGALGVGGVVGKMAQGINVGGSGTSGQSITNATYIADQPRVSLAPKSKGAMSKVFPVYGLSNTFFTPQSIVAPTFSEQDSPCRFSVCISYSVDEGKTFQKLITNFYVDSRIAIPIKKHGAVNDALRQVFIAKPDALQKPWWTLFFDHNIDDIEKCLTKGILYDFQ